MNVAATPRSGLWGSRTPYFWRIYLGYVLVVFLATLGLGLVYGKRVADEAFADVHDGLRERAELAALALLDPLRTRDYATLRERVARLAGSGRLTVVDPIGVVLADSHEDYRGMSNHLQRPEIQAARLRGAGAATRRSQTLGEDFSYFALALPVEGPAFVRVGVPLGRVSAEVTALQRQVMTEVCLAAFLALLVSYFLALRLARPVDHITRMAQEIAAGDFERRLPVGGRAGLGGLSAAINELARASEARLAEITADRNRLAAIFAGMVEGVIDVDRERKIAHINDAAAQLLGVSARASLNKPIWEVARLGGITQALERAIDEQGVVKTQMRLSRKSDELVVDIYAASLHTASGKPIGAVVVLHDVTELNNLERIRTDFVANASHELKTPITAIRGLAETLLADEEADIETLRRFLGRIHQQSLRLSQLVGDLMALSRLESQPDERNFARVDMREVVRRAVQQAEQAREARRQQLTLRLPDEPLYVHGDGQHLSQLVDNLLDNAVKYTAEGGRIAVALWREGEQVLLSVEDNGIGIGPQYQQRVFERFYRVDKARSQSLGGTGLGLSIVKNIAENHGGGVRLESQLGRGSKFTVELPAGA